MAVVRRCRKLNDVAADRKAGVKAVDSSQRSLIGMLKEQVHCKRLGMRGAVLRKNAENSGKTCNGEVEEVHSENSNKNNNCAMEREINSPVKKICEAAASVSLSDTSSGTSSLTNSPKKMVLKLEKCDHVCNSPQKSVNAEYATRALSPFKNSNYRPGTLTGPFSAKHKLDFSFDSSSGAYNGMNSALVLPKRERKDFVEKLFMGSMMLRTKCLECEQSRERIEEFHDISVPVRKEKSDDSDDDTDDETGIHCKTF